MSYSVNKKVSQYVPSQFPETYRVDGPQLIDFTKKYYDYLDKNSGFKSRNLLSYGDIDETSNDYISHYINKYMVNIPTNQIGNLRFLQKHILDLYRSKGSSEGLSLLFKAVYNQPVDYYIPSKDLLRPSDAKWIQLKYIEVGYSDVLNSFAQKMITGNRSGATALVEYVTVQQVNGRPVRVMYLSNIIGNFKLSEAIRYNGIKSSNMLTILGSAVDIIVKEGITGISIGDKFNFSTINGSSGIVKISELVSVSDSTLVATVGFGGFGYTTSSEINVVTLPILAEDGTFITDEFSAYLDGGAGSGAQISITSIINPVNVVVGGSVIYLYETDTLNDVTFTLSTPVLSEALLQLDTEIGEGIMAEYIGGPVINDNAVIADWEKIITLTVGSIGSIQITNAGSGYDSVPTIIINESSIAELSISDGLGSTWGTDAVINSSLIIGKDYTKSVKMFDSGFGYSSNEEVTLFYAENNILITEDAFSIYSEDSDQLFYGDTNEIKITGNIVLGPIGTSAGSWKDTSSMLNSDKYVQDSYYYQDFSYDIKSQLGFSKYSNTVRDIFHPTGNELFGTTLVVGLPQYVIKTFTATIDLYTGADLLSSVDIDLSTYV